ncbi:MAG: ATP-dependent DNA helicase RecG [Burkholderiaceae bacterium]
MATSRAPWPEGLRKLGLVRPIDLLLHLPLRYEDESQVWPLAQVAAGQSVQVQVRVVLAKVVFKPRRTLMVSVEDDTGEASLRFIYFNQSMVQSFTAGREIRVLGEARRSLAGLEFIHPKVRSGWLSAEALESQPLLPVYPTTQGLAQAVIRRHVARALQTDLPEEWLSPQTLRELGLTPLPQAIDRLHRLPAGEAHRSTREAILRAEGGEWDRLRLDELLAQQVALQHARSRRATKQAPCLVDRAGLVDRLIARLPFELTAAQVSAWQGVRADLVQSRPAHRLIQGDVGSGKTVVAALAAAQAVGADHQVAVMAPTEILAAQLFSKMHEWFEPLSVQVVFLKGGLPAGDRRARLAAIASGAAQVVVGTHALIQKDVVFHRLGLSIVDEQHRFGVAQRLALRDGSPHVLGMTATPIPRSLAMTFLADLDVSVIDARPPGRQPIRTRLLSQSRREELVERLLSFIETEGQAYWVCPIIDEQADADRALVALTQTEAWLRPLLGDRLAVVHGRLPPAEKAAEMARFASGQAAVLLATTVIEVGVDVPQARLMVIDHAERFGLAQLHQLRGRVGRGEGQSTCILLFEEPLSELARARLRALYETDDGFELANRDLALRGPGELLGVRQSGEPSLRLSDLTRDHRLVEFAVDWGRSYQAQGASDPKAIAGLLDRWAYRAEHYLTSL